MPELACFWCGFREADSHEHEHQYTDKFAAYYRCYLCSRVFMVPLTEPAIGRGG